MQNNQPSSLKKNKFDLTQKELESCIQCNKCLEVCPVYDTSFTIKALNQATAAETPIPKAIEQFAFSCFQCGYCVPVCPVGLHRDQMIQVLRSALHDSRPYGFKRYLLIRGTMLTRLRKLIQSLFIAYKKLLYPTLAKYMERSPKPTEVLFYPGCYVYSPKTMKKTIELLEFIDVNYDVLAGLSFCCGMPHLLQGDFERAEHCMNHVYEHIQKSNAKTIVTGCMECYEAVQQMLKAHNDSTTLLTIVEFLLQHKEKFPKVNLEQTIAVLPSCRQKSTPSYTAAQDAISLFASSTTLDDSMNWCCRKWNHEYHNQNKTSQKQLLDNIEQKSQMLACDCLTCFETLELLPSSVQRIELIDLFYRAIQQGE